MRLRPLQRWSVVLSPPRILPLLRFVGVYHEVRRFAEGRHVPESARRQLGGPGLRRLGVGGSGAHLFLFTAHRVSAVPHLCSGVIAGTFIRWDGIWQQKTMRRTPEHDVTWRPCRHVIRHDLYSRSAIQHGVHSKSTKHDNYTVAAHIASYACSRSSK